MSDLLRAELLKLRTTRTFFALAGSALALTLLIVLLAVFLAEEGETFEASELFSFDVTSTFVLLLGVIGITGEWRHRTITSSVLAAPDRVRLLAAKVLSYAIAGAVLSLIVSVIAGLIGTVLLTARNEEVEIGLGEILDVLWRNLAVSALLGALGVCIGAIVRNQVAAVIGVIVYSIVIEPVIVGFAPEVGRYGPTAAPAGLYDEEDLFEEGLDLLSPAVSVLVSLGWIALTFAIGALTLRRRDLT